MSEQKIKVLGISAFYHDSAACIIEDGEIVAAAQEERFTRKKHDPSFPHHAVQYCLDWSGYSIDELDAVVFYDKPLLKFERLMETYYAFAPKGLRSFLSAIPVWVKEKLFLKTIIKDELKRLGWDPKGGVKLLFPEHHLSHMASTFYPSPYENAAILTIDGVGEWATATIGHGRGNSISIKKEMRFPHSVGLLYSAFTYYLGFRVNSGEYKLMGLAPYGDPASGDVAKFKKLIVDHLITVNDDGSVALDMDYFDFATGLRMVKHDKWHELFGIERREGETEINQTHCDLALAIQQVTEDIVQKMAKEAKRITGENKIVLAGGVALNCVANGKLIRSGIFDQVWIQSASGDAGGALGAALAAYYIYFDKQRIVTGKDQMSGSYLGPEYSDLDVERMAKKYKAYYRKYEDFQDLSRDVAKVISDENVVGWFQGRMEWGPRALGNRSILGDPRSDDMQKRLNLKIKYRESFRPFAPSVLAEDAQDCFEMDHDSPYMLTVANLKESRRQELPENYYQMPLKEKLYYRRSDLPAITHLDYSARVQTVHEGTNPRYYSLLSSFKELTGVGVLINTSFNVRGEPVVCTPEDAYRCFMRTEMDYLVVGNYVFAKTDQTNWQEESDWQEEYVLD